MPAKICICVLIGLPASGKTSTAMKLKTHLDKSMVTHHICYDDILDSNACQIPNQWKQNRKNIMDYVEFLIDQILKGTSNSFPESDFVGGKNMQGLQNGETTETALHQNNCENQVTHYFDKNVPAPDGVFKENTGNVSLKYVFIIDDNMYYRSMRYEWFRIAKKYQLSFCMLYFDLGLEQCLKINNVRIEKHHVTSSYPSLVKNQTLQASSHYVTNDVIINMNSKLEPPVHEGFEKDKFFTINKIDENTEIKIISSIEAAFDKPVSFQSDPLPDQKSNENLIQTCDLYLRKIVSLYIKKYRETNVCTSVKPLSTLNLTHSIQGSPVQVFAEKITNIKRKILEDLKNGNILVPANDNSQVEIMEILKNSFDASIDIEFQANIYPNLTNQN